MNLSEQDELLSATFAEFAAAAAPSVRPQGAEAARLEVAHRRRLKTVSLGVLAVLALAVPATAYVAFGRTAHGPPRPPSTAGPTVEPSAAPTDGPTPAPQVPDGGPCAPGKEPTVPPGAVSGAELCSATLTLPAWQGKPCTTTRAALTYGQMYIAESFHLNLLSAIAADVDGDGRAETIAVFSCGGEVFEQQAIAFRRARDGGIEVMGRVLASVAPIQGMWAVQPIAGGRLRITVTDYGLFVGQHVWTGQQQERTYGWDGQKFVQVAGPTSFPPNPHLGDLALSAPDLAFSAPNGPTRTASYTLTAGNLGPANVPGFVVVQVPSFIGLVSPPAGCEVEDYPAGVREIHCRLPVIRAGTSASLTLTLTAPANAPSLPVDFVPTAFIQIPEADSAGSGPDGFDDPVWENNRTDGLRITYK